jgi:hypothetical protein
MTTTLLSSVENLTDYFLQRLAWYSVRTKKGQKDGVNLTPESKPPNNNNL